MKRRLATLAFCLASPLAVWAQMGRTTDWWTFAADAQRSGWEKNEQRFTREDVKNFRSLWEMKLPFSKTGPRVISAPVILGNLIGSRGFKELAFLESAAGDLWSIDVDLAQKYWEVHPDAAQLKGLPASCSAFATVPNLPAPVVFRFTRPVGAAPAGAPSPSTPAPPIAAPSPSSQSPSTPPVTEQRRDAVAPSGANPAPPAQGPPPEPPSPPSSTLNAMFRVRPVYMIDAAGQLRQVNLDDASQLHPPREFLASGMKAASLNLADNTIYAVAESCKGAKDASVYALDLMLPQAKPNVFATQAAGVSAIANPAIGANGVLYVQTGKGQCDPAAGKYGNALLALTPKELKIKDYFTLESNSAPVAFTYKGRELVAAAGADKRIYLLDTNSLGGENHKTPLFQSDVLGSFSGGLSTWEQPDGTRYLLAAIAGKYASNANGSIVCFKLQEDSGKLTLAPLWTSPDLLSPEPPVIAQGVVFALADGKFKGKKPDSSSHATLYALDGITGEVLWTSGNQVKTPGNLSGLTIANARLYFTTVDNVLHVFGKYLATE